MSFLARLVLAALLAVAVVALLVLGAVRSGSVPPIPPPSTGVSVLGPCLPVCGAP